ncbi:hypothetical protein RFI_11325 [Reticulomyxa filosa]|uniref:Uncharacterized protein n=1 Tax=Reticulomyxa filosa TaxID=46433 RepID=X6NHL3_RETFI|nr:hypothetical protein RFI_11325 [Reticulomyxa filosa]|eukprot:ETO25815.1 hypothetical protein RFI_11325 [Reticulomyxa filosa]
MKKRQLNEVCNEKEEIEVGLSHKRHKSNEHAHKSKTRRISYVEQNETIPALESTQTSSIIYPPIAPPVFAIRDPPTLLQPSSPSLPRADGNDDDDDIADGNNNNNDEENDGDDNDSQSSLQDLSSSVNRNGKPMHKYQYGQKERKYQEQRHVSQQQQQQQQQQRQLQTQQAQQEQKRKEKELMLTKERQRKEEMEKKIRAHARKLVRRALGHYFNAEHCNNLERHLYSTYGLSPMRNWSRGILERMTKFIPTCDKGQNFVCVKLSYSPYAL